jgi:hypothetical protein
MTLLTLLSYDAARERLSGRIDQEQEPLIQAGIQKSMIIQDC